MQKFILPLVLIVLGILLISSGRKRADSVEGVSNSVTAKIANAWDGKDRQPEHIWYYVGGGALILTGLAVAVKK